MSSPCIEQIIIYTDVQLPEHIQLIENYARRLCPSRTSMISLSSSPDNPTPFLKYWLNESPRELMNLSTSTPFMNDFECFITASKDLCSGEVIYALYQRQIPVLALCMQGPLNKKDTETSAIDNTINTTNPSHLQEVLYRERRRFPTAAGSSSSMETVEESIKLFFDFPPQFGFIIAIESDSSSAFQPFSSSVRSTGASFSFNRSRNASRDIQSCTSAIKKLISSYLRAENKENTLNRVDHNIDTEDHFPSCLLCRFEKVVWLRSDGYPLSSLTGGNGKAFLPPPIPLFNDLKDRLLPLQNHTYPSGKKDSVAQLERFYKLLELNPQLYSTLTVFERHGNRRMIRYLLQRGFNLIVLDHLSTAFQALRDCLLTFSSVNVPQDSHKAFKEDMRLVQEAFEAHAKALLRFEAHWLEMPMPAGALFLSHTVDDQVDPLEYFATEPTTTFLSLSSNHWILKAFSSLYDKCTRGEGFTNTGPQKAEVLILSKTLMGSREEDAIKHLRECMAEYITTFSN